MSKRKTVKDYKEVLIRAAQHMDGAAQDLDRVAKATTAVLGETHLTRKLLSMADALRLAADRAVAGV